ncbi:MAG: FAD-dependent oxidoreductase [Victivallaceae bacterium]|nr:FAD-dependent oxidoreductase [Victivallaceae bacterium]
MDLYKEQLDADLVVVGGGLAGLCAAVAAARNGISVILIQDRPVLGGNASSEVRMWVCGAHGRDAKETGLIEELLLENCARNPTLRYTLWDNVMYGFAVREKNLKLLLNTTVLAVHCDHAQIRSVTAWNLQNYTEYTVHARYFADCSGDSILRLSGAEYRVGREAASEFGESHAPQEADRKTMGNTIMIQLRRAAEHRLFYAPEWAYHFTPETFCRLNTVSSELKNENFWWMEFGGVRDTIKDADAIRHELLRIAYGVWAYLKNNRVGDAEKWELDWISAVPGKRESARYVGEHIMTQPEVEAGGCYPDTVAHGGWSMDDHNPEAFFTTAPPTIFYPAPSPFGIPYRSLYSRNIQNLFFAGRNISATHMALSSTRVMATCATIGQAVGTAAALAVKHHKTPHEIYESELELLRATLSDQDQFLPGYQRNVPALTRNASATHEVLRNGVDRMLGDAENGVLLQEGEFADYTFSSVQKISQVRLVFDSDLSDVKRMRNLETDSSQLHGLPDVLVDAFEVMVEQDGLWHTLFTRQDNEKRLILEKFAPVECTGVRYRVLRNRGSNPSRIFSFEIS